MPNLDDTLETIAAVHAAGLDERCWQDALGRTARLLGGIAATFEVFAPPSQVPVELVSHGLPAVSELEYLEHYAPLSPRAGYAFRNPREQMLWDYKFIDEPAMDRDPFYAKLLPQGDCRYYFAGRFHVSPKAFAAISIQRSKRQGHGEKSEIALLARVLPHFRQAYDVATRLRQSRSAASTLTGTLDWLREGVALARSNGTLVYVNETLAAIAREASVIRIVGNRLEFSARGAGARFAEAFACAQAQDRGAFMERQSLDFAVARDGGAAPYIVSLRPLPPTSAARNEVAEAAVLIFVHDPQRTDETGAALLQAAFGFTAAEAGLAVALRTGISPVHYARAHGLSLNTVYTHFRRIKEKTGTRRQAELIHRLSGLHLPALPAASPIPKA